MTKSRVYELAKEYNASSKDVIELLNSHNMNVKNHMSTVDDPAITILRQHYAKKSESVQPVVEKQELPITLDRNPQSTAPKGPQSGGNQGQVPRDPQPGGNQGQVPRGPQPGGYQGQGPSGPQQGGNQGQGPRGPQQGGYQGQGPRGPQQGGYQGQGPRGPQQGGYQGQGPSGPQQGGYQGQGPRGPQQGGYQGQAPRGPQQGGYQGQAPRGPQQGGYQGQGPRGPQQGGYQGQGPRGPQQGGYQGQGPRGPQQGGYQGQGPRGPQQGAPSQSTAAQPDKAQNRNRQNKPNKNQPFTKERDLEGEKLLAAKGPQRRGGPNRGQFKSAQPAAPQKPKVIKIYGSLTVKELSAKSGIEVAQIIKKLMALGVMATINQEIDADTASVVATEFGIGVEELPPELPADEVPEIEDAPESLQHRPPVVTIMGHVDHGKTSLLDVIRQTNVTAQEAGGITQHIGAYQISYQGKKITFLDTPGHEAFTAMRARGAQVTDIAILVVAADDGVMPQTIEAINHAKSAKVPIIVAINKMDKPGANPDRIKQQLTEHALVVEDYGGDVISVPVSAHKRTGLSDLTEMILLVSEVQEYKANPNRKAQGTVIEAQLDKGRGPVATILVQKGTLRVGDSVVAGTAYGKVRAMVNDRGEKVKKADPSTPVEVLGLSDVPQAGDVVYVVEDEKVARIFAEKRIAKRKTEELQQSNKVTLDDLFKQIQEGNIQDLNIVIKADVQGSVEALRQSLERLKNKEVRVNIVHGGVGAITETDVMLASTSNAIIIGFNVRPDANARRIAETEKVDLRLYRVIYDAINDIEAALTGMLSPEFKEVVLGRAEVRALIKVPKAGVIAGSYVLEGKITSNAQVRLIRGGIVIFEGKMDSLRRFKDDVKEVVAGFECGLSLDKFSDVKEGDLVEAFIMEEIKAKP
jgi:translation initiation factor IF-2